MKELPVCIITGASSGIGQALAHAYAREPYKVGLVARRGDLLDQLTAAIRAAGGTAASAVADVSDRAATVAAIQRLVGELGPADLLIANAGVGVPCTLEPFNVEQMERLFRINFLGVLYAIEAVLPTMLQRGRGHLAAVSSLGAYKGLPGQEAYCASKAALNCYLEGLRIQLRSRGVTVTTICPGFVATPMTADHLHPMPFLLSADEAARRIVRALRRRKKVFDFPRPMRWLMWLSKWAPDWLMARTAGRFVVKPRAGLGGTSEKA